MKIYNFEIYNKIMKRSKFSFLFIFYVNNCFLRLFCLLIKDTRLISSKK
jgi:hypothetical protein